MGGYCVQQRWILTPIGANARPYSFAGPGNLAGPREVIVAGPARSSPVSVLKPRNTVRRGAAGLFTPMDTDPGARSPPEHELLVEPAGGGRRAAGSTSIDTIES